MHGNGVAAVSMFVGMRVRMIVRVFVGNVAVFMMMRHGAMVVRVHLTLILASWRFARVSRILHRDDFEGIDGSAAAMIAHNGKA